MADKFDPYREALVMETDTVWPAEYADLAASVVEVLQEYQLERHVKRDEEGKKLIFKKGIELDDVHLKRPTLEDVFIELTGKKLRD